MKKGAICLRNFVTCLSIFMKIEKVLANFTDITHDQKEFQTLQAKI
jgi:hypothetical protein